MPYPRHPTTIGEHILKRRCELELFQKDVGKQIGVSAWTIMNWEKGYSEPEIQWYPAIISFLGYETFPEPQTLGEKILIYRKRHGLSQVQLAWGLCVDPTTLMLWEQDKRVPKRTTLHRLMQFLA